MRKQFIVLMATVLSLATILSLSSCGGCGKKNPSTPPSYSSGDHSTVGSTPAPEDIGTSTPETSATPESSVETNDITVVDTAENTPNTEITTAGAAESTYDNEATEETGETTIVPTESYETTSVSPETSEPEAITTESESAPVDTEPTISYEERDELVYVFDTEEGLNLRSSEDFESEDNIVLIVQNETELKRIGYNGIYSIVEHNGEKYYCSSAYLTTEIPASMVLSLMEPVYETVYVCPDGNWTGVANLYTAPDRTQHANMPLAAKTALFRTGVYYQNAEHDGWSRVVLYDVETNTPYVYYMRNSVLTTTPPTNN